MSGRALFEVFVKEAIHFMAVGGDPMSSAAAKETALAGVEQAGQLLDEPHASRAAELCEGLRAGDSDGELAEFVRSLSAELRDRRFSEMNEADDEPVDPRIFDTQENRTLRSFFRDEAHEHLERVIGTVLEFGADQPPAAVLDELMRVTHTLKGSAGTVGLPIFAAAAHTLESGFHRVRSSELTWTPVVVDSLVAMMDHMLAYVDVCEDRQRAAGAGDILRQKTSDFANIVGEAHAAPAEAAQGVGAAPEPVEREDSSSIVIGDAPTGSDEGGARAADAGVLRVPPARIDRLVDSVGELVFDRNRITRKCRELENLGQSLAHTRDALRTEVQSISDAAATRGEGEDVVLVSRLAEVEADLAQHVAVLARVTSGLLDDAQALRRNTSALQSGLTSVRMQSAKTLFERLAPQVRAIARELGKRVRLSVHGTDTEFDRSVAEQIADPLVQLLRNAVAHGIESTEQRIRAGKPPVGLIELSASQAGEWVLLELSDDGAGIDTQRFRELLVERDRWSRARAADADDAEVLRAIFEAGVTSRRTADGHAGRGVGLDSVRETVARLGGEIQLTSTPGKGTAFTMRLPLTTALANALLFKVGGDVFAVPNVHVIETRAVEASSPAIPALLRVRDEAVPLLLLQNVLGAPIPEDSRNVPAVVIEYLGHRLAFACDKIVGPREIVVKSLGPLLSAMPLYAGGTISGSGKVQLILDPAALVRLAYPTIDAIMPAATTRPPPVGEARRVLIADDSPTVRAALEALLRAHGFDVDSAENGQVAWDMAQRVPYHAIVTDLEMPELDGFGLIERLRGSPLLADVVIVVVSSRTGADNRERAFDLGVVSFLAKPVVERNLIAALTG